MTLMTATTRRFLAVSLTLLVTSAMVLPTSYAEDMSIRPLNNTSTVTSTAGNNTVAYDTGNSAYYNTTSTPNYGTTGYNTTSYGSTNTGAYSSYSQTPLRGGVSTIPKGTNIIVKLDQPISSESSRVGDAITATLDNDLLANGTVIVPAGSHVRGQVTSVVPTRHMGRHGEVGVQFFEVKTPNGNTIPVQGHITTEDNTGRLRGDSYKMDIAKGVGTAAAGTGIGAVTGVAVGGLLGVAGTGAAMGTGIGAVAGIGYAMARKGKDVLVPTGTRISIKVDEDTNVSP